MPRDRYWHFRDDSRRPGRPILITGLVLGVVLAASLVGLGVAYFGGQARPGPADSDQAAADNRGPAKAEAEVKRVYTRAEFRVLVLGKTPDEVIKAVGNPDRTSESGVAVFWYYDARTTNPATSRTDSKAQLVVRDGKVAEVNY
jgi:hypothetical protein